MAHPCAGRRGLPCGGSGHTPVTQPEGNDNVLTRLIRKTVVLGLAGYGAYRLAGLVQARVRPVKDRTAGHLHDAADLARVAADDIVSDAVDARLVAKDAAQDVSAELHDAAHEMKAGAEAMAQDLKHSVAPPVTT